MKNEIFIADSYKNELRNKFYFDSFLMSLFLLFFSFKFFLDSGYMALFAILTLIPIAIKLRWRKYQKQLNYTTDFQLKLIDKDLEINHGCSKYTISLEGLKRVDINQKKGIIVMIILTLADKNKVYLEKLNKMDFIEKHLKTLLSSDNFFYHRWLHKS